MDIAVDLVAQRAPAQRLGAVVALNESVKAVVDLAFEMDLLALNAILLARRAGEGARGFVVASEELRTLSKSLVGLMDEVRTCSSRAVGTLGVALRRQQRQRLLGRTMEQMRAPVRRLDDILADQWAAVGADEQALAALFADLGKELRRIRRRCTMGIAACRAARVEAAYGGASERRLADVSEHFDDALRRILPALGELGGRLEGVR